MSQLVSMIERETLSKFLRYGLVGLVGTILDFMLFTVFMLLGFPAGISRAVGYLAGSSWAYFLNRFWVFSPGKGLLSPFKFVATYATSGAIAVWIQASATDPEGYSLQAVFIFALSITVATLVNFISLKFWVFPST